MKRFSLLFTALVALVLNCFSQAGTLDPSFGTAGKVYTNLVDTNRQDEAVRAIAIQADGKIVVVGSTYIPACILRCNTNGSLDNSFDNDGMAFCFGMTLNSIAIQSDGKIVAAGSANGDFALVRFNTDGKLDNSFDSDGKLTTAVGTATDVVSGVAIQSDGKLIVAGYSYNGSNYDFAMARYNTDGTLDNTFDGDGKLTTTVGLFDDFATSLALQSDSKIVVAGYSNNGSVNDFALARYNVDGSLDNSFDSDGKLITVFGPSGAQANSIAIQNDGKILTAGFNYNGTMTSYDFALTRYNINGSLDNSFDSDGKVITNINSSSNDQVKSVAIQNDGKIIVAGQSALSFAFVRYNTDGSPDNSFDADGIVTTNISSAYNQLACMVLQNDGKIVAAGRTEEPPSRNNFALVRYNMDGSLDTSLDGDGKATTNIGSSTDFNSSIAVQNDGKIILAGFSNPGNPEQDSRREFALARYNPNGTLDNSFDGDGRLITAMSPLDDYITCLAIQSDGKIVAAGTTRNGFFDFTIARYNPNGSLDSSFDGDGKVFTAFGSSFNGFIHCMVIQADGKIVVAGNLGFPNANDFLIARYNTDGSLDNSFDNDGLRILNIGSSGEDIYAMAIQSDGKIVVAGYTYNGSNYDFALARFNTNGSLDNSFDNDGMLTTAIGSGDDQANSMIIQSNGKIVVAGYSFNGSNNDFAIVRYNTNGSLDNSFDSDGKLTTDLGSSEAISSVAIQNDGKILVEGTNFELVRYNNNGILDNSFDGDGKLILNPGTGNSASGSHITLYSNRIYVSGSILTEGALDFVLVAVLNDAFLSALPLQLVDFSGKRVNEDALVSWKTENETNMLEYVVERSVDGRNYTDVGTISAANRTGTHNYNFTDCNITSLNASVIYYRLRQKGIDGKYAHSRIVALPVDKNKNIVLFYPNPVINEANVAMTVNRAEQLRVRIIDNKGRLVKQMQWNVSTGSTSLSIDVKNLASGMYYLEIKGESVDYKKQFIK